MKVKIHYDKSFNKGMSLLQSGKFDEESLMPICLPPTKEFEDTNRGKSFLRI